MSKLCDITAQTTKSSTITDTAKSALINKSL